MRKTVFLIGFLLVVSVLIATFWYTGQRTDTDEVRFTDTKAGFDMHDINNDEEPVFAPDLVVLPQVEGRPFAGWGTYWQDMSPMEEEYWASFSLQDSPFKVGIQSGHWRVNEVPEELDGLRRSGGGAVGGGTTEAVTVLEIAKQVQTLLEAEGIEVDLLPATIPPSYLAHAFVSIHADGSTSPNTAGFKISGPRRDFFSGANALVEALYEKYEMATGMGIDQNITRRMSSYYAFNFRRYEHALHPFTPAVIIETGFMTNAGDRAIIVDRPELPARGIADGVIDFLNEHFGEL